MRAAFLFYLTRKAPFGEAHLSDGEMSVNFGDVTTNKDKVTILVTIPLTKNETWQQIAVDECLVFQDGDVVFRDTPSKNLSVHRRWHRLSPKCGCERLAFDRDHIDGIISQRISPFSIVENGEFCGNFHKIVPMTTSSILRCPQIRPFL